MGVLSAQIERCFFLFSTSANANLQKYQPSSDPKIAVATVSAQLKIACRLHTTTMKTGDPTIDACFDADRLDLWRAGITPDPEKLATEKGKQIAKNTDYAVLME